jgi:putative hydroxymethylpyrimidine transport system substrate-binding protein
MITRRTALATALAALAAPAIARNAAAQGQPFTLLLDWFVNPDHGPVIVADELGYFRDAGLAMKIVPPADPNDPPRLVAAGRGDVAVSYPHLQIRQAVEDIPTARIGALIDTPLSTITVLADGPIKKLADFRGRKIGYSISGVEGAIVKTMLGTEGVRLEEVELVNVNFSLSPALLTKRVDGVIGAFRNFELIQLELEGSKGRAFFLEEHGVPTHDALTFCANREKARAGDPRLRAFLTAVERGALYCTNNPDEAWKLFIRNHKDLDNELNRRAWKETVPRFAHTPGGVDRARERRFAEFMHANGLIARVPPLDSYVIELG